MVDATTTNILLTVPARGNDPGTWDVPVNSNSNAIDGFLGGIQVVSASNSPITLTAPSGVVTPTAGPSQAQNAVLRITGTLTGNVQITLPMPGYFIVENLTTGAFVLSFRAVAVGEVLAVEQGVCQHIYNDGTNVRFVNLPTVGSYLDLCDSVVPAWITSCTKPPYLICDGSTFSAITYPYLSSKLGGNTLPDFRGRAPYYLNGVTGRLTAAGAGIDGSTRFAGGGNNGIVAAQIPQITVNGTVTVFPNGNAGVFVPVNSTFWTFANSSFTGTGTTAVVPSSGGGATIVGTNLFSGTNTLTSNNTAGLGTTMQNAAPGVVSGIRLIRAA